MSFVLLGAVAVFSQTTATNFTATDCNSVSHNLFSVLDSGKVVVLVWVMPCTNCISDSKAAYDAAQSFATSYPGRVLYWMSDDLGNSTCTSISGWANTNLIGPANLTVFGNVGTPIDEGLYGGSAMPHVLVIGPNHHVYLNIKNGSNDLVTVTDSIAAALATLRTNNIPNQGSSLKLFPNPAKDKVTLSYNIEQQGSVSIEVFNIIGNKVKTVTSGTQYPGEHSIDLNFEKKLANGIYFLKVVSGNSSQTIKFNIAN